MGSRWNSEFVGEAEAELGHREVMELLRLEMRQKISNTKGPNVPCKFLGRSPQDQICTSFKQGEISGGNKYCHLCSGDTELETRAERAVSPNPGVIVARGQLVTQQPKGFNSSSAELLVCDTLRARRDVCE